MKKRIFSLLLALLMLFSMIALTACGNDPKPPIPGDTAGADVPGTNGGDAPADEDPEETEPEKTEGPSLEENGLDSKYFSDFIPDENAQYTGKVGLGANKAGVDFDTFRVISSDKKDIYLTEFTDETAINTAIFTGAAVPGGNWDADMADWAVTEDDLNAENKQLTFTAEDAEGANVFMGNTEWGPYRVNVKVKLADETEIAYVLFCVQDEKNYYALEVAADHTAIIKVTDGKSETVQSLGITTAVNTWVTTSVFLTYDTVTAYVAGSELIRVTEEKSDEPLVLGNYGVGQWNTQFYVDNFRIVDIATGDEIYFQDFEDDDFVSKCSYGNRNGGMYTAPADGDWEIVTAPGVDGADSKMLSFSGATSIYGAMLIFPEIEIPSKCEGYRIEMDAFRVAGSGAGEFTAIVWGYKSDTDYWNYNYGGWSGMGAVQEIVGGSKTNHTISNLIGMETGVWQTCTVEVFNNVVYSYYNGNLIQVLWLD